MARLVAAWRVHCLTFSWLLILASGACIGGSDDPDVLAIPVSCVWPPSSLGTAWVDEMRLRSTAAAAIVGDLGGKAPAAGVSVIELERTGLSAAGIDKIEPEELGAVTAVGVGKMGFESIGPSAAGIDKIEREELGAATAAGVGKMKFEGVGTVGTAAEATEGMPSTSVEWPAVPDASTS